MGCANLKQQSIKKRLNNTMIIGNNILSETSTNVDDQEEIKKRGQFTKISAIRASHTKNNVESFQIAYELDCGSIITGLNHQKMEVVVKDKSSSQSTSQSSSPQQEKKKSLTQDNQNINRKVKSMSNLAQGQNNNKDKQLKNEVFEILEGDYLQEISGRIGQQIEQLTFKTYKGRQMTFGNGKKGKQFQIMLSKETFGPFTTNQQMNTIKIPIIPVPEQFYEEQNNQNNIQYTYQRNKTH